MTDPRRIGGWAVLLLIGLGAGGGLRAQTSTYGGREPNAPWRAPAAARIEQLRKGDFAVRVVDSAGRPVAGASVSIAMQRHAYPFGSALQMARIVQDSPTNRIYRQKAVSLFNAATTENDLKWGPWTGEWGPSYARTQTLAGIQWLRDRNFPVRGHVLVWPGWGNLPNSIVALRGTARQNEIPARVVEHIYEQIDATRHLIDEWDLLNEPFDNHDLMDLFGLPIMVDWFRAGRAALPNGPLYLNDWNTHNQVREAAHVQNFENHARYLLQNGAPVTGLGLQAHMFAQTADSIPDVLATIDRYVASTNLPVRITEFDFATTDDTIQADYTRDFLTAMFSHPAVAGFQFWGFWESAHWRPTAAMYRPDWTEKPSGAAYRALAFDQWWTRLTVTTDASGIARGRGFYGDYRATVSVDGTTLEKTFATRSGTAAPTVEITVQPPRLANLATRAPVGTTGDQPIAGFVISGSTPKLVLVRAAGPALAAFGLTGTLARPTLTLVRDGQTIATNTGWATAANAAEIRAAATRAGAFALAGNSADSALLVRLAPGAYTARVTAADGGSGVALVEAYEAEADGTRFANISTRGFVGTGAAIMIPGLVVSGPTARTFLIRAVGPGLADFGVSGTLARPALVLMRDGRAVQANDHWETAADPAALVSAAQRVGAFPLRAGNADAALLVTLEAGAYTLLISGADGGTGNCLAEIYEVAP